MKKKQKVPASFFIKNFLSPSRMILLSYLCFFFFLPQPTFYLFPTKATALNPLLLSSLVFEAKRLALFVSHSSWLAQKAFFLLFLSLSCPEKSFFSDNNLCVVPDAPRVELALGASISPTSIYEGGDVYFDCRIESRPPPKRIHWRFDVSCIKLEGERTKNSFSSGEKNETFRPLR